MIGVRGIIVLWAGLQLLLATGLAIWGFALWPAVLLALAAVPALLVVASRSVTVGSGRAAASPAPLSFACPVLAAGLTMAAVGLMAGLWFVLLGAEVAALGLVLLVLELRAGRRAAP